LSNLWGLDLSYNQLGAGDWSFLSSLANCTQLKQLFLDGNGMRGSLPSAVGDLPSQIEELWLKQNKFTGRIPLEIGNLTGLSAVYGSELVHREHPTYHRKPEQFIHSKFCKK
jgi:Leucine-rich repeat (LRR) protein